MPTKENLGPGVREVVEKVKNPLTTIDLKDLNPGDRLIIKTGDEPRNLLDFTIVTPAKEDLTGANDSARAILPGWKWSSKCDEKKVRVLIGGTGTYNPSSRLGITMLSIGKINLGRNLILWRDEEGKTDDCLIFMTPVEKIVLKKQAKIVRSVKKMFKKTQNGNNT